MSGADAALRELRLRGEWWQVAPGLVGMRGPLAALYRAVEAAIAALARRVAPDEWQVPGAIALETLARADYFASFPQWLTVASHLTDDADALERVATDPNAAAAVAAAVMPPRAALSPAVCYHVYAALAGGRLAGAARATVQGTCWRHEGSRLTPLERGWAFTMREIVYVGSRSGAERFRRRGRALAEALARRLGLGATVEEAADPFFAPTARGRALLQRVKALKHELLLPIADGRTIAAASFNHHEGFFGDAFDIRLDDGSAAASACVAFGIERWVLAVLARYGPDPSAWPAIRFAARRGARARHDARTRSRADVEV